MGAKLTPDQERAVLSTHGDLAIAAGAGTGKTTVLARRFAEGVATDDSSSMAADIERVLTITFTVKAAGEIAERARRVVGEAISLDAARRMDRAWISTIHGLCSRLIRRHPLEAGVEPGFSLADELQASLLQAEAFEVAASRLCLGADGSTADADVTRVFEVFAFETVKAGVIAMHERARSMGLDPRRVQFPTGEEELGALTQKAVRQADDFLRACTECRQTDAISRASSVVEVYAKALSACELGDAGACEELDAIVGGLQALPSPRSPQVLEMRAALVETNGELGRVIVGMRESATMRGLQRLLEEYAKDYAARKSSRALLDHEDLQEGVLRLFERNPDLAARYRRHFRMIMVDEFQDTNDLQMRVLEYLRDSDFCIVGDEHQSIYGFRNADVRIFRRLRSQIEDHVELRDNFRSHADLLGFVNGMFGTSSLFGADFLQLRAGRIEQPSLPVLSEQPRVRCLLVDKGTAAKADGRSEEALRIAQEVRRLIEGGVAPGDIAVLLRNSTNAPRYASAIEDQGHVVNVSAGERFFESQEVAEVLALLRVLSLPADDEALISVLSGRFVRASNDALFAIRAALGPRARLFDALRAVATEARPDSLSEADYEQLASTSSRLQALRAAQSRLGLGELIYAACEAFDYDLVLFSMGAPGVRAWANVQKLVSFAEEFEEVESSALGAFVEQMRLRATEAARESMASVGSSKEAVQVMTIHASKGLEFPVVIVADLGVATARGGAAFLLGERETDLDKHADERVPIAGIKFPDPDPKGKRPTETLEYRRLADEAKRNEVEEQKRCLYVACTRARERLLLTGTCGLDKEPGDGQLVDWVRGALGNPQESGTVELGGVDVGVEIVRVEPKEATEGTESDTQGTEREAGTLAAARALTEVASAEVFADCPLPPQLVAPEAHARGAFLPPTISYTQLHQFDACPFSYYVRSVMRLRSIEQQLGATNFGSALHALLQQASPEGISPSVLDATCRRYRLDGSARARLVATAERFLGGEIARRAYAGERVDRESPLRVPVGDTHLVGNMDLLSWTGQRALIVDYKTGEAPPKDSPRLHGYRLQASCYALAVLKGGAEEAEVVFVFVEHDEASVSFEFQKSDLVTLERDIAGRLAAIESSDFPHLDSFRAETCRDCPAGGLCPVKRPHRGHRTQ